uniref:Three-finger toxin n=1 Tax=Calliophis bivirgatus TaxID=8633 RepID=A0A898IK11_CALBG|nr:three-finger toxin [Calliophis bivirgatus]
MKTLLLTLVVVTIMCLDLGYTLKCYEGRVTSAIVTCEKGMNICAKIIGNSVFYTRKCAATCPVGYSNTHCCDTDRCNEK